MFEGNQKYAWDHTANICAAIYNTHRDPKSPPIKAKKLNPLRNKEVVITLDTPEKKAAFRKMMEGGE
jgi:hypothetical protein